MKRPASAMRASSAPVCTVVSAYRHRAADEVAPQESHLRVAIVRSQHDRRKAGHRVRRLGARHMVSVHTEGVAALVDVLDRGLAERSVGRRLERRHAALKELRHECIVVGGPLEVLPASELEYAVEVGQRALVDFVSEVPDARVGGGKLATDFRRVVRRSIVGYHQVEVGQRLTQYRLDRLGKEALAVVDR
jgi:hypothetical protein